MNAEPWMPENAVDTRRVWNTCPTRASVGEMYLRAARGLDVAELERRELVRFHPKTGAPLVLLYDLAIGRAVLNVVRRSLPRDVVKGAPKTFGLRDCPTLGSLVGNVDQIRQHATVVVVEGVIDSLTAALAWPDAVVLGAHGALRLPEIADEAAHRVRKARGRLYLAVHNDDNDTGQKYATAAGLKATAAGLRLDRDLLVVEHPGHKDLNDAWQAGWRP